MMRLERESPRLPVSFERSIIIRKGKKEDAEDFSRLILHSAPKYLLSLFGYRVRSIMSELFRRRDNVFSFEYSYFIEVDGRVAGMALAYGYRAKKKMLRNNLSVLRCMKWTVFTRLGRLLKASAASGRIREGEHYLSGLAVYPRYRGCGLGTRLLETVENNVRESGSSRIVLRTGVDNKKAVRLYERSGYRVEHRTTPLGINGEDYQFFRITKDIRFN
jgi:ribosomal protein S18 acetylase RimI-like enzyme